MSFQGEIIAQDQKIKYTPVPVSNPLRVKDFLTGMLGFMHWENTTLINGMEGIVVWGNKGNDSSLFLLKSTDPDDGRAKVIINTDDCLRDYHQLTEAGVRFITKPEYISMGLAADLVDADGNEFTLLEERNYSDEL